MYGLSCLTELSPKELSLEPIRADALILRQSDEIVLHKVTLVHLHSS